MPGVNKNKLAAPGRSRVTKTTQPMVVATLVTTNLALDELEKRWDGRVMSRLYGSCQAVGFSSVADYRRVQRQEYLEVVATL